MPMVKVQMGSFATIILAAHTIHYLFDFHINNTVAIVMMIEIDVQFLCIVSW